MQNRCAQMSLDDTCKFDGVFKKSHPEYPLIGVRAIERESVDQRFQDAVPHTSGFHRLASL